MILQKAINMDPEDIASHANLAVSYQQLDQDDLALQEFDTTLG